MTEPSLEMHDGAVNGGNAANGTNGGAHPFAGLESGTAPVADPILVPPAADGHTSTPQDKDPTVKSSPAATATADCADIKVADVRKNRMDCRGEKIDFVFFRRRDYAIYRSGGKILVHYSDDEKIAREQAANTADLLPLRGRLQYLVRDMDSPHAYHWQIAESFRLGLDGQKDAAKSTLQAAIDNIVAKRVSKGRTAYMLFAGIAAILVVFGAGAAALWFLMHAAPEQTGAGPSHLLMATGSGAMGALLSTAIALRARTQATDGDLASNAVDSALRILIGVISAAALYLVLDSNLLAGLSLSVEKLGPNKIWQIALLSGFLAGFLERLVPDLLENKLAAAMAK